MLTSELRKLLLSDLILLFLELREQTFLHLIHDTLGLFRLYLKLIEFLLESLTFSHFVIMLDLKFFKEGLNWLFLFKDSQVLFFLAPQSFIDLIKFKL
jgi:hypothetical protein